MSLGSSIWHGSPWHAHESECLHQLNVFGASSSAKATAISLLSHLNQDNLMPWAPTVACKTKRLLPPDMMFFLMMAPSILALNLSFLYFLYLMRLTHLVIPFLPLWFEPRFSHGEGIHFWNYLRISCSVWGPFPMRGEGGGGEAKERSRGWDKKNKLIIQI